MSMRMLIDARHPEETRVAVVKGNRIEEFDFEAAEKRQIKGNIYLAKVTRVEPSLQAAFIEYGGNRHGFLAFSEIHPDYYQIPKEDREALLREEHAAHHHDDHHDDAHDEAGDGEASEAEAGDDNGDAPPPQPEEHGGHEESASEALRRRRMNLRRRYKIQEVIRRRQVMLVQVVKEERGNKGAALTTYLSLAGRYSVLMPNTSGGGGISRKISSGADRKRLKEIIGELALPAGMGCIVRTAGLKRTKAEIRRDFDYLTRLWDEIREATLKSTAPALIYQDSDLIKRAIRDIYSREIDEVIVDGEEGYKSAKAFMKLLMPSHAKKVKHYVDPVPLFQRSQVEPQLASMYHPVVQLKSGGYIVINPTEALVSIDINSGRSTREHNIEETALKTNLEAADEIARQLRLRDMAGLVVIDFIDMEHGGNARKVERAMKEALKNDRARIQVGRISSFGLLEMSRQRLRTGVLEASTHSCPMCDGAGVVRSIPSAALAALRGLEAEAIKGRASEFRLRAGLDVAVYILNRKRDGLVAIESKYGVAIDVVPDDELIVPNFAIDAAGPPPVQRVLPAVAAPQIIVEDDGDADVVDDEDDIEVEEEAPREPRSRSHDRDAAHDGERDGDREERGGRRRRRRRRRGGRREREEGQDPVEAHGGADAVAEGADAGSDAPEEQPDGSAAAGDGEDLPRRRRGRRGGRRRSAGDALEADSEAEVAAEAPVDMEPADDRLDEAAVTAAETAPAKRTRAPRRRKAEPAAAAPEPDTAPDAAPEPEAVASIDIVAVAPAANDVQPAEAPAVAAEAPAPDADPAEPPRRGWWQRTFGS